MQKLLLGPLLGIESDILYTICFLSKKDVTETKVIFNGDIKVAKKVDETPTGFFWRCEIDIEAKEIEQSITYSIEVEGELVYDVLGKINCWSFFVNGVKDEPSILYASCNGFSSAALKNSVDDIYCLWKKMRFLQDDKHFSLMLMGGDQIYADEIWESHKTPSLKKWIELPYKRRIKAQATQKLKKELENFYDNLYRSKWGTADISIMLATIPTVMMWDDHDLFDGWGSYPDELLNSPVYQAIFKAAKRYFEMFQLRTIANKTLLHKEDHKHYTFAFEYRNYTILGLDIRTQRRIYQVMDSEHWNEVISFLNQSDKTKNLLLMSSMPVVYRDFSFSEKVVDFTPWTDELTDDIKDHWRAKAHQGERLRLVMWLLKGQEERYKYSAKTIILSGDVHIGALGVINDQRTLHPIYKIHQVISSGIIHTPPTPIEWLGIKMMTNDDTEYLREDNAIEAKMLNPIGSAKYLRTRNFSFLQMGTDQKIWVNWVCEYGDNAHYPME